MPNAVSAVDPVLYSDRYYISVRNQILGAEGNLDFTRPVPTKQNGVHCTEWNQTNLK
jgi:hypothetical protein